MSSATAANVVRCVALLALCAVGCDSESPVDDADVDAGVAADPDDGGAGGRDADGASGAGGDAQAPGDEPADAGGADGTTDSGRARPPIHDARVEGADAAGGGRDAEGEPPPAADAGRPMGGEIVFPPRVPRMASCGDGVVQAGEWCPGPAENLPEDRGTPYKVILGDLDGDGLTDFVSTRTSLDDIAIRYGRPGETTPRIADLVLVGDSPVDVVAGDVDGDGDDDLVVANLVGESVTLIRRDGPRTWARVADWDVGGQPFAIAGGDFDEDGRFDVMVANFSRGGATVLFGAPGPTLERIRLERTGIEPHGGSVADVDGDGHDDLLIANAGTHDPSNDFVTISWGRGDGTFEAPLEVEVENGPFHVEAGDLDGDGLRDIAVANFGTPIRGSEYAGGDVVSVVLNEGGRRFGAATHYRVGNGPNHLALADLNHDGHLDIATAGRGDFDFATRTPHGGGTTTVLFGDGLGGVRFFDDLDMRHSMTGVTTGDVDGDGTPDVAGAVFDGARIRTFVQVP